MRIEKTGEISTALLLVSAFSGFVLAYQYEVAAPFISTTAIEAVLPFGSFWRSVHFWSSQAFFLALAVHVWQCTDSITHFCRSLRGRIHWVVVGLTLPMALYALFSGYVLRFDGTGQDAGRIAEHLLLDVPLLGTALDRLVMATADEGLNRVYAVHILFTVLCWGIGTWYHTRRVTMGRRIFFFTLSTSLLSGALLYAPIDLPDQNLHLIKGPWFFLGIQELLRYLPPVMAGIAFPMIPIAVLLILPWLKNRKNAYTLLSVWFLVYATATLVASLR